MWTGGALVESAILGGGAADVTAAAWKGILACARSAICFRAAVGLGLLDYYPPNQGFASDPISMTLQQGQIIVRNGSTSAQYASPIGTSLSARALPFGAADIPLGGFEVLKPIENVLSGPVQGWFGQAGGGIQYYLGVGGRTIQSLIESGHLGSLP